MLPRSRPLRAGGTPRFCPSTSFAMLQGRKRAGTPCSRRRRRAAMPPGWRVGHAHGASSEGRRADSRAVCTVPRHGARRGAPVRRAAQPRGRRAGARPGAAGRRWAPAFASRCQAPGPSPGCRCGCVRIKVGAARCCARHCPHASPAAQAWLALRRVRCLALRLVRCRLLQAVRCRPARACARPAHTPSLRPKHPGGGYRGG